ncbi:MAG: hypothetical protein CMG00_08825 [Candidatus Marinimicrobia bacterium]|nr:hypothetical protein [Candidatus Neomarinimicrobiota bacterium]|tara:strand:- start:4239 stop:5063 length:825 start_codon:yes stop_codon:yes gene_type:complete
MKRKFHIFIVGLFLICLSGCSSLNRLNPFSKQDSKQNIKEESEAVKADEVLDFDDINIEENKTTNIRESEPFYPIDETVEDIQEQINNLKSRVIEYESKINRVALDPDLLKMIKTPLINHEIELSNGTLVQGSILQEDIDRVILKTQIGQIRIEKSDIISIKEIAPNSPNLVFESEPEQKIYDGKRVFEGTVLNDGMRRSDFTRVVFYLWDEDTNLIASDSAFVNGSVNQYSSGIITDSAVESGNYASYKVSVSIQDTADIRYITKEIHFNIYD